MILCDSDVLIDLLREYPSALEWFDSLSDNEDFIVSGYVVLELIQGCKNRKDLEKVQKGVTNFSIYWLPPNECEKVLGLYSVYKLSHNVGILDIMIGQTAISLDSPLITFNKKHYNMIPNIKTIQPYSRNT